MMAHGRAAALSALMLAIFAGPAMASTSYPLAPTGFATGSDGWTEEKAACTAGGGAPPPVAELCRVNTRHNATEGSPAPGSLEVVVLAALFDRFTTAEARLVSPELTVDAPGTATVGLQLRSIRRQIAIPRAATTTVAGEFVPADGSPPIAAGEKTFTGQTGEDAWAPATFSAAELAAGAYRLRLTVTVTSEGAVTLNRHTIGIDDVTVDVADGRATLVDTLAATGVTADGATLRSRVVSDASEATSVTYELRQAGAPAFDTLAGPTVPAGASAEPNAVAAGGLQSCTDFEFRAVGTTTAGAKRGDLVTFTTKCPGPEGQQGAPGAQGSQGAAGRDGGAGQGVAGSSTTVIVPRGDDVRRLLRIDARRITVPTRGRWRGRGRVRIFCRRSTITLCNGIVKVRTVDRINPASRGRRPRRRVTFTDTEYQLPRGAVGYAVFQLNQQRLDLLRRLRSVRVRVSVTVLDSSNNRQTLTRTARLRVRR